MSDDVLRAVAAVYELTPHSVDSAAVVLAVSVPALAVPRLSLLSATDLLPLAVQVLSLSVPVHTICSGLTGSEDAPIGLTGVTVVLELAASGCTTAALGYTIAGVTAAVGSRGATDTVV